MVKNTFSKSNCFKLKTLKKEKVKEMNKKFFAALASSALLFTTTGNLAFAAEEMEEMNESSDGSGAVSGTDVEQSTIELNEVNFPDPNFRTSVKLAYAKVMGTTGANGAALTADTIDAAIPDSTQAQLADLAKIVTLAEDDQNHPGQAADYFSGAAYPFKNIKGVKYLTGLQYLSILNSPQLKEADVSQNENLQWLKIVPRQVAGADAPALSSIFTFAPNTDPKYPRHIQSSDLYSLTLPDETDNLTQLVIGGAEQLTTLDLSDYSALEYVDVQLCELADLDVTGCTSLNRLNVSGNQLTNLNLSKNSALTGIRANDNEIYEINLPSGKNVSVLTLYKNKLSSLDVSHFENLAILDVSDNRIEKLDLSKNNKINHLNVSYNHLASLDLSGNENLAKVVNAPYTLLSESSNVQTPTLTVSPQYLYANVEDEEIDLGSYDQNFQKASDGLGYDSESLVNGTIEKGVFSFSDTDLLSSYNYQTGDATGTAMTVNIVKSNLMNRLYNPNSGEHLYTHDLNEKDVLTGLGWKDEGIGWVSPAENEDTDPVAAGADVFRLYNPNAGDHHYTKDANERDTLVRLGWNYEGVGWYSADEYSATAANNTTSRKVNDYSIEVFREYDPNAKAAGAHNYTIDENENDTLVSLGWIDEGIGWWALK